MAKACELASAARLGTEDDAYKADGNQEYDEETLEDTLKGAPSYCPSVLGRSSSTKTDLTDGIDIR